MMDERQTRTVQREQTLGDEGQLVPAEQEVVRPLEERVEPVDRARNDGASEHGYGADESLFSETDAGSLRQRWESVQAGFVDEPRHAVEEADKLVADAIGKLTDDFARERARLEQQWSRGDDASTEDLRIAFQRYRSFFQRLLSA